MCIMALKSAGVDISDETIRRCFEKNPDGAGFSFYSPEGGLDGSKGYFRVDDLIKAYREMTTPSMLTLLHFRWATIGAKNTTNCQPFGLEHGVMAHNGPCVNHQHCRGTKDMSDSMQFAEEYVQHHTWEDVEKNKAFITAFVGIERLVFLFDDGRTQIINEKHGEIADGIWYSNSGFKKSASQGYASDWDYSYGRNSRKQSLIWSDHFKRLVPKTIQIKNETFLTDGSYRWNEAAHAYIRAGRAKKFDTTLAAVNGYLLENEDIIGAFFATTKELTEFLRDIGL